jgi:hypothetical protein
LFDEAKPMPAIGPNGESVPLDEKLKKLPRG